MEEQEGQFRIIITNNGRKFCGTYFLHYLDSVERENTQIRIDGLTMVGNKIYVTKLAAYTPSEAVSLQTFVKWNKIATENKLNILHLRKGGQCY